MVPLRLLCILIVVVVVSRDATAADWPMWRYDAARSGSTPHGLPGKLHLRWTRQLPPPRPAWPASQFKLQFDAGYEPVCADGKLLIGSSVDGSVVAFDVETAKPLWRFFTDGPVRFAPLIDDGRVYVVSDGGCLHCLDLKTGHRNWAVQGGPSRRRIIGNGQLTSLWPARGGVVVQAGVAYFAAGIWPSMGVFVKAVNADTGEVLWNNSTTGSVFVTHPHGAKSFGSISPQGYLAISGDNLLVPGGRTLPGVFGLASGELRHFDFGGKGEGGYRVIASGDYYFARGNMRRTIDGLDVGSISAELVGPSGIIGTDGSAIVLTSTSGQIKKTTGKDRRGKEVTTTSFQPEQVKKISVDGPSRVYLQAGSRVFAADGGRIAAYEFEAGRENLKSVWSTAVDGDVWSMIAADEHLFVTTKQGHLYCFGDESSKVYRVDSGGKSFKAIAGSHSEDQQWIAEQLAGFTRNAQGYAVSIGTPSFRALQHVVEQSELTIVAVDTDEASIRQFRELAVQDDRFGIRVSALTADLSANELPSYFASVVFCEELRDWTRPQIESVFEILRPYGGTGYLRTTEDQHRIIVDGAASGLHGAKVSRVGEWTHLQRVGALQNAGVWTHQYGDASSSAVSADARVKTPLGLLWFGGPANDRVLPRHGHGPSPQVAGGRLFIEGVDMLRCVDVYTGRVWWEREFPGLGTFYNKTSHHPGAGEIGSNYVSLEDHVYLIHGTKLLQLSAQTGDTTHEFKLPADRGTVASWGALRVEGNVLIAAAAPVSVPDADKKEAAVLTKGRSIISVNAKWRYLAGTDPAGDWADFDFNDSAWKTGTAGFGYGDKDDRTKLTDMKGNYPRVYIRHVFRFDDKTEDPKLQLHVNYDDAFIAYLNGHEIARTNIKSGRGPKAKDISSHESGKVETFSLTGAARWLKRGKNVLAIEGHNRSKGSSDFTLDPFLVATSDVPVTSPPLETSQPKETLADVLQPARYSSASRTLLAFDRHSGQLLWSRDAKMNFRHNAICAADGRVYAIDALSPTKLAALNRRGVEPQGESSLLAVDARSGEEIWSTTDNVFGTFLSYSREHDVLLQGGSAYRDRAADEVGAGLAAYRGSTGKVIWKDSEVKYGGPCLLHGDRIITNGAGGFDLELLTGRPTGWKYSRMYGCNTAIGSQHLLTFRSGAAGFCDLAGDSGTGNIGGFRSSCTSNLIVADGVLNAPDYTRTCSCSYQLQTSLALVHMPEIESWTFGNQDYTDKPVRSLGINLGAPGDRRDSDGVLWFDYPAVGGPSPKLSIETVPRAPQTFLRHSSLMDVNPCNWVAASGLRGLRRLQLTAAIPDDVHAVNVRLIFSEPDGLSTGQRVFSVSINGKVVVKDFDIAKEAGTPRGTITRDFPVVTYDGTLDIRLTSRAKSAPPVLSGVAIKTP